MSVFLQARGLARQFGPTAVLEDVSFTLGAGETLAVVGRSGCGKTTLLKVLAGILAPGRGSLLRGGVDITQVPVRRRDVLYLYQEPLLFPHLSVFENVAFGLRLRGVGAAELGERVRGMLDSLGLQGLADRDPLALSGGQRQRVSFGRALVVRPSLLLLDEPFSSLDPETRAGMRELFRRVAREYAITALFVTHDVREALEVGDRLARLAAGRLRVYEDRAAFVADPASGVQDEIQFWRQVGDGREKPVRDV